MVYVKVYYGQLTVSAGLLAFLSRSFTGSFVIAIVIVVSEHINKPAVREAATICPRPLQVDIWLFDLESGVRVTRDVAYLYANFSQTSLFST